MSRNVLVLVRGFADAFVLTQFTMDDAVLPPSLCFTAYYILRWTAELEIQSNTRIFILHIKTYERNDFIKVAAARSRYMMSGDFMFRQSYWDKKCMLKIKNATPHLQRHNEYDAYIHLWLHRNSFWTEVQRVGQHIHISDK